jgi:nicotinate-nucleotide adenylyltransferase
MKIGILGGTFDPIHFGHLLMAEWVREAISLDEIWFMPALRPPHKMGNSITSDSQRVDMIKLAIAGHPQFRLSMVEVDRGGVSYTVETLERLHQDQPEVKWYLLMGADSLDDFATWRSPRRICELATPVVVGRVNAQPVDLQRFAELTTPERLNEIRSCTVDFPLIELSSTEMRRRVAQGLSIRYQTPRSVEVFIQAQGLYTRE